MRDFLSAIEFVLFLLALGGLCSIIARTRIYKRLNKMIFNIEEE